MKRLFTKVKIMISKFEEIDLIVAEIKDVLERPTSIFIIGGAALMHHDIGKGFTKDIDIVFRDKREFDIFKEALIKLGFKTKCKPISHQRLNIFEMLERDDFRFDLFVNIVCEGFCLSAEMINRALEIYRDEMFGVFVCSMEDILIFKSLSPERPNDIEDSIDIIKRGVDWNIVYDELLLQSQTCPNEKKKNLIWYFIERMDDLGVRGIQVPIKNKVIRYYNSL